MFFKVALFAFVSLFISATAGPIPDGLVLREPQSQCNTGALQCCTSLYKSDSAAGAWLLGTIVGLPIQNVATTVGFDCSPITAGIVGAASGSGSKCAAQPVCCNQAYFNGVINNGCNPTTVQS